MEMTFPTYTASQNATCPTCANVLRRLPSYATFTIHGYNAKTNYSSKDNS
jgi:hypothetical protein